MTFYDNAERNVPARPPGMQMPFSPFYVYAPPSPHSRYYSPLPSCFAKMLATSLTSALLFASFFVSSIAGAALTSSPSNSYASIKMLAPFLLSGPDDPLPTVVHSVAVSSIRKLAGKHSMPADSISLGKRGGIKAIVARIVPWLTLKEARSILTKADHVANAKSNLFVSPLQMKKFTMNKNKITAETVDRSAADAAKETADQIEDSEHLPRKASQIITIPMSRVPPRVQLPGSPKGMPHIVRIVEIHRIHQSMWQRSFRRRLQSMTSSLSSIQAVSENETATAAGNDGLVKNTYSVELRGGIVGVGEYYAIIELGNKKIRVQIDTGSSTLAVPMDGCQSCVKKANRYSFTEAPFARPVLCDSKQCAAHRCMVSCPICSARGACCSPERPNECGFSLRYADGSEASGSLITDEVRWGELAANMTFGGILASSPNFERPEVDGILGMAYKSLACNPSCFDPPFDTFVNKGLVDNVFSICMTGTGGKLMLGGFTPSVAKTPIKYVPLHLSDPAQYYRVKLTGEMRISDEIVAMPNFKTAIVDTGTTLIVMSTRTFAALKEHLERKYCHVPELCGEDSWFQSGMCVSLSAADLAALPTLTFNIGGKLELVLNPADYMLLYSRGGKTYRCVGIMGMDGLGGMVVLGNTLMQRYVTVYDRANSRIGFAEAADNCGENR
jgi:hypothetical protein